MRFRGCPDFRLPLKSIPWCRLRVECASSPAVVRQKSRAASRHKSRATGASREVINNNIPAPNPSRKLRAFRKHLRGVPKPFPIGGCEVMTNAWGAQAARQIRQGVRTLACTRATEHGTRAAPDEAAAFASSWVPPMPRRTQRLAPQR